MHAQLSLVTPPAVEPVELATAKAHLRVDHSTEDQDIARKIAAARRWAENFLARALITQTWRLHLDAFPFDGSPIELPMPPLQSVTHVKYRATDGTLTTWPSASYVVDAPSGPTAGRGRLYPAYGETYPTPQDRLSAVEIQFVAGYGDAPEDMPAEVESGLLLRLGDLYVYREDSITGTIYTDTKAAQRLLWPIRSMGWVAL